MPNNVNFFSIKKTNVGTNSVPEIINDIVKYISFLFLYLIYISFIFIPYDLFTVLQTKNV